jgi:glucosamine 6-phosphate synthetase-like amidotransferase/phosphosugar isomerase protein
MEGIEILQNRGYDSAGVALFHQDNLTIHKLATDYLKKTDCIEKLKGIM